MLLGESLVLFWTLKKTVSFPLTFTSELTSTPPAYGRTRTLAEVVRNNGERVSIVLSHHCRSPNNYRGTVLRVRAPWNLIDSS